MQAKQNLPDREAQPDQRVMGHVFLLGDLKPKGS